MNWLKGKKTYFVLGIGAIAWLLETIGIVPAGSLSQITPVLMMAGGSTVAAKINRLSI
jgi:hypothetical protein